MMNIARSKQRDSNIELLRIICMIMILAIHANFFSTGNLTVAEANSEPVTSILRSFAHALCACAVNTFVMISGHFGINFKVKGITSLIFQSLFFSIGIYLVMLIFDFAEFSKIDVASSFMLFKQADNYWFVWAYIILYILSPVINPFCEKSTKEEFKWVLILFFIIQSIIDFTPYNNFFQQGFSPLSFIGLYMIARYFKRFEKNIRKSTCLFIFCLCVIVNTIFEYSLKKFGIENVIINSILSGYTNPITIIQSLSLLLYFSKLKIQSKTINWIAASCFAVYLFHIHFCIVDYYKEFAKNAFINYNGILYLLYISLFIAFFFITPIFIDKIRIYSFRGIWTFLEMLKQNDRKTTA